MTLGLGDGYKRVVQGALANKPLQYVVVIGGLLVLIFLLGRKYGKSSTVVVDYPKTNGADGISDEFVNTIAPNILNSCYEAFEGYSVDVDKKTLAVTMLQTLTDNQLRYTFNAYNNRYLLGKNASLYTSIDGDYFGPFGTAAQVKKDILKRMRELGMDKSLV